MTTFNVYRYRTRSRSQKGVVRVWQGEARHEADAVLRASQAHAGRRFHALFARDTRDDPYASDPRTIVEEN